MKATIYHNPRCSKSRSALAILKDQGIELDIVEYLKTPPEKNTLKKILKRLNMTPFQLLRQNESIFIDLGITDKTDAEALIELMVDHPILIERPIVLVNNKAVIARPPETVLHILKPC